jgi:hypothetical protein
MSEEVCGADCGCVVCSLKRTFFSSESSRARRLWIRREPFSNRVFVEELMLSSQTDFLFPKSADPLNSSADSNETPFSV